MNRLKDRLDPLMKDFLQRGPAGCACAVRQRGNTLYENHFGYADLEAKKPVGQDTIYRVYSMSKPITCTAALMLYERGLFALNDPLEAYLPEFRNPRVFRRSDSGAISVSPASRPIRVRDLFMMTSGYPYPGEGTETGRELARAFDFLGKAPQDRPMTLRDFCRKLADVPLAFDPGTHWMYGLSHDVLGALIEVVSGKSFGQYLKEAIFDPLGMADTSFRIAPDKRERLSAIYDRADDGTLTKNISLDADYQPGATMESGGGGLLSTLGDYSRFAHALALGELDGVRLLGDHTIRHMAANHLTPQLLADYDWVQLAGYGYGLGVRVMMDPAAGGCNSNIGEFGWMGYAGTLVYIDPAEGLSIVYMQQMVPNLEEYHLPRLRDVVYGAL